MAAMQATTDAKIPRFRTFDSSAYGWEQAFAAPQHFFRLGQLADNLSIFVNVRFPRISIFPDSRH
jgi:hypothetical protein